jgi:hypothetical protein
VIVNDVDTDRLRRAARLIRADGADVTMPPKAVATWLEHVAVFTERAKLGEWIPGLQLAGAVANTVAGVDLPHGEDPAGRGAADPNWNIARDRLISRSEEETGG